MRRGTAACVAKGVGDQWRRSAPMDDPFFESGSYGDVVQVNAISFWKKKKKKKRDQRGIPFSEWLIFLTIFVDNLGILMDCWSCHPSRTRQVSFGAGQAKYGRLPRYFHRISARRTSRSVSWQIALFVHLSSSVSCIIGHTIPRFAYRFLFAPPAGISLRLLFFQAALPSLYPHGLDGRPQLSPTGAYELKVFFNGAHRRVSAYLPRAMIPKSHFCLFVDR